MPLASCLGLKKHYGKGSPWQVEGFDAVSFELLCPLVATVCFCRSVSMDPETSEHQLLDVSVSLNIVG